jgi:hypothetical protein
VELHNLPTRVHRPRPVERGHDQGARGEPGAGEGADAGREFFARERRRLLKPGVERRRPPPLVPRGVEGADPGRETGAVHVARERGRVELGDAVVDRVDGFDEFFVRGEVHGLHIFWARVCHVSIRHDGSDDRAAVVLVHEARGRELGRKALREKKG